MKDENPFDKLKKSFENIGSGMDGESTEGLPRGMVQRGERMVYGCAFTVAERVDQWVREDGPDAQGALVCVPAGGSYRRGDGEWRHKPEGARLWIESVGSVLEIAYVEDGRPVWERHVGVAY